MPDYPIKTARLTLRPFTRDDLDALHAIQSLEEVTRFLYWQPRDREQVRKVLDARLDHTVAREEGEGIILAVVRRDSGELVGDVNLEWRSREHRQGEIGFVLHPRHQGQGLATEAADEMLRLGFDELRLHRIEGRCDARNVASARVLEKLGMRREAHLIHNEIFKGEWSDELIYAILGEEWRDLRSRPVRPPDSRR